jgi:hypothetical protein
LFHCALIIALENVFAHYLRSQLVTTICIKASAAGAWSAAMGLVRQEV